MPADDSRERLIAAIAFAGYVLALVAGFALHQRATPGPVVDEILHGWLIRRTLSGAFSLADVARAQLPMLPGYHFAVGWLADRFGTDLAVLRRISFALACGLIPAAIYAARAQGRDHWVARALQVLLIPWLPVMCWLVYSDAASMLAVLLGYGLWRAGRVWPAGLLLAVACAVRQNNLVWALALAAIQWVEAAGWHPRDWRVALPRELPKLLPFAAPVAVVATFYALHGSLVIGDPDKHPVGLHPTQVYFLAVVAVLLYAPDIARDLPRQAGLWIARVRGRRWLVFAGALLATVFYLATLENTHPYNQSLRMTGGYADLDDHLIGWLDANLATRLAGFAALWVFAEYWIERFWRGPRPVQSLGLLAASAVFLLPSWMLSFRYTLLPLAFLALTAGRPALADRATAFWHVLLAVAVAAAFLDGSWFW